jgi:hypothetical protein
MKPSGYLVVDRGEDWEQPLTLRTGDPLPPGGVLSWGTPAAIFPDRATARAAIVRTHYYRLAFGSTQLPERKSCEIVPALNVKATK